MSKKVDFIAERIDWTTVPRAILRKRIERDAINIARTDHADPTDRIRDLIHEGPPDVLEKITQVLGLDRTIDQQRGQISELVRALRSAREFLPKASSLPKTRTRVGVVTRLVDRMLKKYANR